MQEVVLRTASYRTLTGALVLVIDVDCSPLLRAISSRVFPHYQMTTVLLNPTANEAANRLRVIREEIECVLKEEATIRQLVADSGFELHTLSTDGELLLDARKPSLGSSVLTLVEDVDI